MTNLKSTTLLTAALLFLSILNVKAQQANFSGTWIRNNQACRLDTNNTTHVALSINSIPIQIVIKNIGNTFGITRVSIHGNGDTSAYTENLKPGGAWSKTIVKPNLNKSATMQWSVDHQQFTENADYVDNHGNPVQKATETWSFLNDGKQLQIKDVLEFGGQEHVLIEVFDRE